MTARGARPLEPVGRQSNQLVDRRSVTFRVQRKPEGEAHHTTSFRRSKGRSADFGGLEAQTGTISAASRRAHRLGSPSRASRRAQCTTTSTGSSACLGRALAPPTVPDRSQPPRPGADPRELGGGPASAASGAPNRVMRGGGERAGRAEQERLAAHRLAEASTKASGSAGPSRESSTSASVTSAILPAGGAELVDSRAEAHSWRRP